jgi:transcriptional regulator of nitric oxide reductase
MNKLHRKILLSALVLSFSGTIAGTELPGTLPAEQREPRAVVRAKKKQEAKDRQLKKDYEKFVKDNKKRSFEIQTPEVQERMKQNQKDADAKYKAKKKANTAKTKRAAKKYKR